MPNWNGAAHLEACLESLLAEQVPDGLEVLVVDNGSHDGSAEQARRAGVRVLELGRNRGFAGGCNAGIAAARGANLAVLNNDTRVQPGWIEALLAQLTSTRVAAVTSKVVYAHDPRIVQNAGLLLLEDGGGADRGDGLPAEAVDEAREVFGFCGAAALIRREALADVGAFDPTFFAYYEDLDLSWRMRLRGWSVRYAPRAVVEHQHAATSREGSEFFTFHADRNRVFTLLKNARAGFLIAALRAVGGRVARRPEAGLQAGGRGLRAGVHGRVAASLALHAPEMLAKRARIRSRRSVADAEIERWLTPRAEWRAAS